MFPTITTLFIVMIALPPLAMAQECLPDRVPTTEQQLARRDAVRAARLVNTAQANHARSAERKYLTQAELQTWLGSQRVGTSVEDLLARLDFRPGAELIKGWEFTFSLTNAGYWFVIKDKNDPCGYSIISSQDGIIYTAEPIR